MVLTARPGEWGLAAQRERLRPGSWLNARWMAARSYFNRHTPQGRATVAGPRPCGSPSGQADRLQSATCSSRVGFFPPAEGRSGAEIRGRTGVSRPATGALRGVRHRHRGRVTMTTGSLIQMRSAGFRVAGKGRGQGLVLLYQDKLARVSWQARSPGIPPGTACPGGHRLPVRPRYRSGRGGCGVLAGGWIGEMADRRMAARRVAEAGGGVTVILLDSITGVHTGSGGLLGGRSLVVTTQDGTEYRFCGRLGTWQADLAAALTVTRLRSRRPGRRRQHRRRRRRARSEAPWNPA